MAIDQMVIGIREANSVDFVKKMFECFNKKILVAIVKQGATDDIDLELAEIIEPDHQGGWLEIFQPTISDDLPAQVVFTSGTEGKPKTILLHHKTLENTVIRLNRIMEVDETIREYIGVPVHYSFGFGRVRAICAIGGKAYIPKDGFNPSEIRKMLETDSINAISAVPTLWRILLANENIIGKLGKKVKWIEIGSQFMSAIEKKQMIKLFPNANIIQHYGLTEASRSTFLKINEINESYLNSVGLPTDGIEITINHENRIMIRGGNVCNGIYDGKEFRSVIDIDGWLLTNDIGHLEDGRLYYDGRADDIINSGGIKINPDELQIKLEKQFNVANQIVVAKYPDKLRGDGFLVAVIDSSGINEKLIIDSLGDILNGYSINAKSSIKVIRVADFPRTATGKIQRAKISEMCEVDCINAHSHNSLIANPENYLYKQFSEIFPGEDITPDASFVGLGGDSLNYVQLSMALENHLGYIPNNWENTAIEALARCKSTKKTLFSEVESSILLRFFAISAVVLTHSGIKYAGGGTLLLFVLIGYNMGRFKHSEFVQRGTWNWFADYAIKILIPYYILTILNFAYTRDFDFTTLILMTNLIDLKITGVFPFWFVQVLIQSLFIISLLFSSSKIRTALNSSRWKAAMNLLLVFTSIRLVAPHVWNTEYLRDLVPQNFLLLIWLGYCFSLTSTIRQRYYTFLAGLAIAYFDSGIHFTMHWLISGSFVLAFIPNFKIPSFLKTPVYQISTSTFYIFIFNGVSIMFIYKAIGFDRTELPNIAIIGVALVATAMSILIWKISIFLDIENRVRHALRLSGNS